VGATVLERVPQVASLVVRHVAAYGELLAEDLGAARAALERRLWLSAILAVAVLLCIEMACVWVLAMTWNTPDRQWAICGMALFFVVVAAACAMALRAQRGQGRAMLPLSSQEWQKDQRLLTELLSPAPARMP
jgi:uncharacterized membrane protein YqjE